MLGAVARKDGVERLAKSLMLFGVVLVVVGAVLYFGRNIPLLGRLPGDIRIQRPGFTFYFPLTTSLIVSVVLSVILYFASRRP